MRCFPFFWQRRKGKKTPVDVSSQTTFTLRDVRIFTGAHFIDSGHVVVVDGRIAAVGKGPPPGNIANAPVLSRRGFTLLPGLIDSHVHCDRGNVDSVLRGIRFGVTTVLDMHNEHSHVKTLFELARDERKKNIYADYRTCGTAATIPGGWPEPLVLGLDSSEQAKNRVAEWPKLRSPEDAAPFVASQIGVGATYIKVMHEDGHMLHDEFPLPSEALQSAIISAAHAHGLMAVGHAFSHASTLSLLACGADGTTHAFLDAPPAEAELVAAFRRNGAHCCPTLGCLGSLTGETAALQAQFAADPLVRALLGGASTPAVAHYTRCMGMAQGAGKLANAVACVRALHDAGVDIVAGSDAANAPGTAFGLSLHQELHMYCTDVGMEPAEALKTATLAPAQRFGLHDRGAIEVGRKADLVLCEGDVEKSMRAGGLCLPVVGVWRDGVVVDVWKNAMSSKETWSRSRSAWERREKSAPVMS